MIVSTPSTICIGSLKAIPLFAYLSRSDAVIGRGDGTNGLLLRGPAMRRGLEAQTRPVRRCGNSDGLEPTSPSTSRWVSGVSKLIALSATVSSHIEGVWREEGSFLVVVTCNVSLLLSESPPSDRYSNG